MQGWVVLIWVVLLALPWVIWGHRVREWPRLRQQGQQGQAATRESVVQHSDAGMRSLQEKKWSEAVDAFDRALDLLESHEPRQLRGAQQRQGRAEDRGDRSQEVSLLFYRGFALEQMGELEEAIADYEDCQAISEHLHQDLQYVAAVRHGLLLAKLERGQEAEQHLRQTISALQSGPQSLSWLQVEAFQVLVGLFRRTRDRRRVVEYAQQGARAAHRLRDAPGQAGFLRAAGDALHELGHPDEALRCYEQSLDLYRRIGEPASQARVKRSIALLYQSGGQWDKALAWLQACLVDEERDQNKKGQAQLCYDIACMHIDQGNLHDAGMFLQQSISLFRQAEDHEGIDQVGRTMMGLSIVVHRHITADQMTFRDVERGSAKSKKEGK